MNLSVILTVIKGTLEVILHISPLCSLLHKEYMCLQDK